MSGKRVIAGAVLAGAAVATALGGAASAAQGQYPATPESGKVAKAANPKCLPGLPYQWGWGRNGDKVFLRDCKADGWGARVNVNRITRGTELAYTGLTLHDPSAKGNGSWKGKAIAENEFIVLHVFSYKGKKTAHHYWAGIYRS